MRFGLSLPHYGFSLPGGTPITFEACAAWAERAETLGFDSVWVSDHFFYSFGRYGDDPSPIASLEPLTTLAGLAARTERIRLGTLVLCAPFRHPGLLLKTAASLDALSNGRLDLGVGAGWFRDEFRAFGYEFGTVGERFDRLTELLELFSAFADARGAPVRYEGTTATLRDANVLPSPVQRSLPIWVGGKGGPRLLRLAARHAAGWNVVWRMSPGAYDEKLDGVRTACEAEGRDPSTLRRSIGLHSLIGEDEAAARAAFDRARAAMPGDALRDETYASWCADTLSGSPERILERVAEFEVRGVEELIVSPWVLPFAIPEPDLVELFAERVIGSVRAAR